MAEIGAASAVITFLQLGFSLAKTLNSYVAEVKDTPEEISSLATDVDATLRLVQEVNNLLAANKTTKRWNDSGVIIAEKCCTDSKRAVERLVELLNKSGCNIPHEGTVGRQNIPIALFTRARWPVFRLRVESVKQEIERTRIGTLLAIALYNNKPGSSEAEKQTLRESIAALRRKERAIERRLEDRRRDEIEREHILRSSSRARPYRRQRSTSRVRRDKDRGVRVGERHTDREIDKDSNGTDHATDLQSNIGDKDPMTTDGEMQGKSNAVEESVQSYKRELRQKLELRKQEEKDEMSRLMEAFGLSEAQVEPYIREQRRRLIDDDTVQFIGDWFMDGNAAISKAAGLGDGAQSSAVAQKMREVKTVPNPAEADDLPPKDSSTVHSYATDTASRDDEEGKVLRIARVVFERLFDRPVPLALQDEQYCYPWSSTIVGITVHDNNGSPFVTSVPINHRWLIKCMRKQEKLHPRKSMSMAASTIYSCLSEQCRKAVQKFLAANARGSAGWSLLYAETESQRGLRVRVGLRLFGLERGSEVRWHNAFLIFKTCDLRTEITTDKKGKKGRADDRLEDNFEPFGPNGPMPPVPQHNLHNVPPMQYPPPPMAAPPPVQHSNVPIPLGVPYDPWRDPLYGMPPGPPPPGAIPPYDDYPQDRPFVPRPYPGPSNPVAGPPYDGAVESRTSNARVARRRQRESSPYPGQDPRLEARRGRQSSPYPQRHSRLEPRRERQSSRYPQRESGIEPRRAHSPRRLSIDSTYVRDPYRETVLGNRPLRHGPYPRDALQVGRLRSRSLERHRRRPYHWSRPTLALEPSDGRETSEEDRMNDDELADMLLMQYTTDGLRTDDTQDGPAGDGVAQFGIDAQVNGVHGNAASENEAEDFAGRQHGSPSRCDDGELRHTNDVLQDAAEGATSDGAQASPTHQNRDEEETGPFISEIVDP